MKAIAYGITRLVMPAANSLVLLSLLSLLASPVGYARGDESRPALHRSPQGVIVVNTLEDELNGDGDCALREAITAANTNAPSDACPPGDSATPDTITFNVTGTITLTSQLPTITAAGPLVIDGGNGVGVSGANLYRVLYVDTGADVTLQNLAIADGLVTCCDQIGSPLNGGGLYNKGTLTIVNSTFANNTAWGSGGGLYSYQGSVSISNSAFIGNQSNYGGGLSGKAGVITITDSTFIGNSNLDTSGGYGGALTSAATLFVANSTFADNTTIYNGGALWITVGSSATVENSTFTDNSANGYYGRGGGIASDNNSVVVVNNSTFSDNSATIDGSALSKGTGSVIVKNTILSNHSGLGNCLGTITDGGYNLDSGSSCNFDPANHSMSDTESMLGPLADNGGPTFTHALAAGSPAINTADCSSGTAEDQRGVPRPQGAGCDIGSYEYAEAPFVIANPDTYDTQEDAVLAMPAPGVLWNDLSLDAITATILVPPVNGSLELDPDGSFTYTPNLNAYGSDGFTYLASDGTLTDTAVVSLTIYPVNDSPVAADDSYTTTEDTPLVVDGPGLLLNDTDVEGDPLAVVQATDGTHGVVSANLDGSFVYTPTLNFNGIDGFTYVVSDGTLTDTAAVTITVDAVNDAPLAIADVYTTTEDTLLNVPGSGVLANDLDVDGDPLTVVYATGCANGVVSINLDGSFVYTPTLNFNGPDGFTYEISDGVLTDTTTVAIIVTPVNDAPLAFEDTYTTTAGVTLIVDAPGVLSNDTDIEGGLLIAHLISPPAHGRLDLGTDGSFIYTPLSGFIGIDSFAYLAEDNLGSSNSAFVFINVVKNKTYLPMIVNHGTSR